MLLHFLFQSRQWVVLLPVSYTHLDVYKRQTLNQAVEQQAGMIDPRREILNMAMEKQIELLNQKVAALSRENKELKRKNEKLQKALRKQDLNFIKNL